MKVKEKERRQVGPYFCTWTIRHGDCCFCCFIPNRNKEKEKECFPWKTNLITYPRTLPSSAMPPKKTLKKVIQKTALKPTPPAKDTAKKTGKHLSPQKRRL